MATFIISGDPISIFRPRNFNAHCWDSLKQLKHSAINQLEEQFKDQEPYLKPINIEYHFYFRPIGAHRSTTEYGYNHSRPDITDLIKFVENVSVGILFKDTGIIASISSFKRYSELSRTEIIITEL